MAKLKLEVGQEAGEATLTNVKMNKIIDRIFDSLAPKFDNTTDPPTPIVYTRQMKLDWFMLEVESGLKEQAKQLHRSARNNDNEAALRIELAEYD